MVESGKLGILFLGGIASFAMACYGSDESTGIGESGLERSHELRDLAPPEAAELCDWGVSIGAIGFAEVQCPAGNVIEAATRDECVQNMLRFPVEQPDCHLTVGDAEPCFLIMGQDPCVGFDSPQCQVPPACLPPPPPPE